MEKFENNDNDRFDEELGFRSQWVIIAEAENRTVAEFAVNGLRSYDIPAVLDARPGVLGTAGLSMRSLRTGKLETFKIMVPSEHKEEAAEVVKIFLGNEENRDNESRQNRDEEE
jgi:hypothetical protein